MHDLLLLLIPEANKSGPCRPQKTIDMIGAKEGNNHDEQVDRRNGERPGPERRQEILLKQTVLVLAPGQRCHRKTSHIVSRKVCRILESTAKQLFIISHVHN
jgi:hypothetical protein